jgi:hypothetical protein
MKKHIGNFKKFRLTESISDNDLESLIQQYFDENLIGKFSDEDGEYVKEIIRDFVKNYYQ